MSTIERRHIKAIAEQFEQDWNNVRRIVIESDVVTVFLFDRYLGDIQHNQATGDVRLRTEVIQVVDDRPDMEEIDDSPVRIR